MVQIDSDGDVRVEMDDGRSWLYNPDALTVVVKPESADGGNTSMGNLYCDTEFPHALKSQEYT